MRCHGWTAHSQDSIALQTPILTCARKRLQMVGSRLAELQRTSSESTMLKPRCATLDHALGTLLDVMRCCAFVLLPSTFLRCADLPLLCLHQAFCFPLFVVGVSLFPPAFPSGSLHICLAVPRMNCMSPYFLGLEG